MNKRCNDGAEVLYLLLPTGSIGIVHHGSCNGDCQVLNQWLTDERSTHEKLLYLVYISTFSTGIKLDKFDMPELENPPHRVSKESLINFKKGRIMHKFRILCVFFYSRGNHSPNIYQ